MRNFLRRWLFGIVLAAVSVCVGIFIAWLITAYPVIAVILIIVLIGLFSALELNY